MRILVIDDDPDVRESVRYTLGQTFFNVDTADNGELGVDLALNNSYDLIILDFNLPKKNGKSVCSDLRKQGCAIPILVLSVISETTNKIDLLNTGADDYLTKPFSTEELIARVRAMLRRPQEMSRPILQFDDVTLDQSKQIVRRGKKIIDMTHKEYLLLEYLLQHPNEIISRPVLLEYVWDANADILSNTIETHICGLRRKIDHGHKKKLIHTIPGRGYKLSEKTLTLV